MDKKEMYTLKGWGGVTAKVLGRCKYCKSFSMAEIMEIDPLDKKPYHKQCKETAEREKADDTMNFNSQMS